MSITYVPKEKIYPAFGMCYPDGRIEIVEGLPECVTDFLISHEQHHLSDKPGAGLIKKELSANLAGFKAHPLGGLYILFRTVTSWDRLWWYWTRWRGNK